VDVLHEIANAALDRGVKYLTVYVFSTENWSRAQEEVGYLMELFYVFLKREFRELEKRRVRLRFLGRREGLPPKLLKVIDETEGRTAGNTAGTLALCLNYGGKPEVVDAYRAMMADGVEPDEVTPEVIGRYIYAPDVPPVDMVIRSSGEQRLSGFMLWRSEYAEFCFVQKHWPDFTVADLDEALADYAARQRRFGS
jgi:undecaprenyl diphosphate synthase